MPGKKNTPGKLEGAEGLLDLLGKVQESFEAQAAKSAPDTTSASGDDTEKKDSGNNIRLFSFPVMENVLKAARLLAPMYHGSNTLYKDEQEEMYLLALARSDHSAADFNRICNMLSEYGALERASAQLSRSWKNTARHFFPEMRFSSSPIFSRNYDPELS